jgi:hypothetical protein
MGAQEVDLVLAVDCSQSMAPCFQGLVSHLGGLLQPLESSDFEVRIGVIAMAAYRTKQHGLCYPMYGLSLRNLDFLTTLYGQANSSALFTTSSTKVVECLKSVPVEGDEDLLMLLDSAADFPFGPSHTTRRVVAMFSDEPIEDGLASQTAIARIGEIGQKYMTRRIKLFAALPHSPAADQLAALDGSEVECISGGDGLTSVDFRKLFAAMAKSISVFSTQGGGEASYKRALFGQDTFVASKDSHVVGK